MTAEKRGTVVRVTATRRFVRSYGVAVLGVAVATLSGVVAGSRITLADQAMLYLPGILLAAFGGRGASLAAAVLSVGAYDFFFVPPRFTFAVSDMRSLITFAVMFGVGATSGELVSRLREAQQASRDRELRTAALLEFTRDAAAATEVDDVVAVVVSHLRSALGVEPTVRIPDDVPLDKPLAITVEPALSADLQRFVLAVAHQAGVAIGRLQLAATARDAALRVKAEELRSALLSTVSHDLRTPLAVITGMATALRDGDAFGDPPDGRDLRSAISRAEGRGGFDAREAIDTIVEEAQRLSRILTNLLSITKVESGAAPRREWVPLEELAGTALHRLETALAGHPVAVEIEPTALAHVDPILVEQLLINLLENAAKHTPPGTPIAVRASRDATGATLEVNDRGPGLPAVPPAQLFDRFFRGERTTAAGVGLGLAVCRGIAVAHGGKIEAAPHVGGGAVFRAHFPDDGLPADLADPDEPIEEAR